MLPFAALPCARAIMSHILRRYADEEGTATGAYAAKRYVMRHEHECLLPCHGWRRRYAIAALYTRPFDLVFHFVAAVIYLSPEVRYIRMAGMCAMAQRGGMRACKWCSACVQAACAGAPFFPSSTLHFLSLMRLHIIRHTPYIAMLRRHAFYAPRLRHVIRCHAIQSPAVWSSACRVHCYASEHATAQCRCSRPLYCCHVHSTTWQHNGR